jgi:hypothetical protein
MRTKNIGLLFVLSLICLVAPVVTANPSTGLIARPPPNRYCNITNPSDGATVSGVITITVDASKTPKIYIDGELVARSSSYNWDTTLYADGSHTILADSPGASDTVTVTVDNGGTPPPDTEPPVVTITNPTAGATVSGTVSFDADATDNVEVDYVEFYIDGVIKSTDYSSPYSYSWDTTAETDGDHTLKAIAVDTSSNTDEDQITVTVDNSGSTPYPELTSGETVYSSLSGTGDTEMWMIWVDDGCEDMHSVLNCGNEDYDLYGKHGSEPTTSNYDWRGYTYGGEDVHYANPASGWWYIMVRSYSGSGAYDLTVTLSWPTPPPEWSTTGTYYAVIDGISDYQAISDLSYCDEDATDWYNHLNGMGYECHVWGDGHTSDYPVHHGKATEYNVRNDIQALAAVADAGDTVVYCTSGHGSGDGNGYAYLCMWDCDVGSNGYDGDYTDDELAADISLCAAGVNVFVFIDHCYSGGMGPELMALSNSQYIYCTTTCTDDGYGYDDPTHNNGAWTYYFLDYSWQQHYGSDPYVSMETVFTYAHDNYPHTGGDEPQEFDGDTSSYFYLN